MDKTYLLQLILLAQNEAFIFYIDLYTLFLHSRQCLISKTMLFKYVVVDMGFLE